MKQTMNETKPSGWQRRTILFLTSQCITLFGSTLVQMAVVWYATMETASGAWVAAFTVCSYLPQFLISFSGGVWADRYSRKLLIAGADALTALATLAMLLAVPHITSKPLFLGGLPGRTFCAQKLWGYLLVPYRRGGDRLWRNDPGRDPDEP